MASHDATGLLLEAPLNETHRGPAETSHERRRTRERLHAIGDLPRHGISLQQEAFLAATIVPGQGSDPVAEPPGLRLVDHVRDPAGLDGSESEMRSDGREVQPFAESLLENEDTREARRVLGEGEQRRASATEDLVGAPERTPVGIEGVARRRRVERAASGPFVRVGELRRSRRTQHAEHAFIIGRAEKEHASRVPGLRRLARD